MNSITSLLEKAHQCLDSAAIDHALIGAFALAVCGVVRATNDVDFLIDGDKAQQAKTALASAGFSPFHESAEVIQLQGFGPVDLLLARRPLSLAMLARAKVAFRGIKCVDPEDLIALKIQAYKNDVRRETKEKADIQRLIEVADLDWSRVKGYADLFGEWKVIAALCQVAGKVPP